MAKKIEIGGMLVVSGQIVYNPFNPQANLFQLANPAGSIVFSVSNSGSVFVSGDAYIGGVTSTN